MDFVKYFSFCGSLPASKSIYNRALIVQSFFPFFDIEGKAESKDVEFCQKALSNFPFKNEVYCGEGAAVFRFLLMRYSRQVGKWRLSGSSRLLERPHEGVFELLEPLGVVINKNQKQWVCESSGWKNPLTPLRVKNQKSSQFLSGLLLSAWQLDFTLNVLIDQDLPSIDYLTLTIEFLNQLGMEIEFSSQSILIPSHQQLKVKKIEVEQDMSSLFPLAVLSAIHGELTVLNYPIYSFQPDSRFVDILNQMGVPIEVDFNLKQLKVSRASLLKPICVDLKQSPDLFPCLSLLCALASGVSTIYGVSGLVYKESNRLEKVCELLKWMGVEFFCLNEDVIEIQGKKNFSHLSFSRSLAFDPDQDHRMAMLAGLLEFLGAPIEIKNKSVVDKSFSCFWDLLNKESCSITNGESL